MYIFLHAYLACLIVLSLQKLHVYFVCTENSRNTLLDTSKLTRLDIICQHTQCNIVSCHYLEPVIDLKIIISLRKAHVPLTIYRREKSIKQPGKDRVGQGSESPFFLQKLSDFSHPLAKFLPSPLSLFCRLLVTLLSP